MTHFDEMAVTVSLPFNNKPALSGFCERGRMDGDADSETHCRISCLCYNQTSQRLNHIGPVSKRMNVPDQLEPKITDDTLDVTTAQVLAEVERRRAERRGTGGILRRTTLAVDRFAFWFSKHWLFAFNAFFLFYVGLPILAPILMHWGVEGTAKIIYTVYRPLCHQLPQRSFFLFGPQLVYPGVELMELFGMNVGLDTVTRAFVGNEAVGYKTALCQRDIAIYGLILLSGLLYGLLRRNCKIPSLPWWAYIGIGVMPMLLDGGYQFVANLVAYIWPDGPMTAHETTPTLRVITGALFGLATVWLSFPLVQEAMEDVKKSLHRRFGWE